jgi:hypothetical protein
MKLNSYLFELDAVYRLFNHSTTWATIKGLRTDKQQLEVMRDLLAYPKDNYEIMRLADQIAYLTINIKTFGDALLAHESKIFEKRITLGDLQVFALN